MTNNLAEIIKLLESCTKEEREEIFKFLRQEFCIHPLEAKLNTQAEVILEAFSRAGGLVLRMLRGVIAQAAFATEVVENLHGWQDTTPAGDLPYDFCLTDGHLNVRVQVKLQRSQSQQPLLSDQVAKKYAFSPGMYVVETQRSRAGSRKGQNTRPYRFNEFDILAVSMYPSTHNWSSFKYTVASWLLADPLDPNFILTYQPISPQPNNDWTDDFLTAISWLQTGQNKRISR